MARLPGTAGPMEQSGMAARSWRSANGAATSRHPNGVATIARLARRADRPAGSADCCVSGLCRLVLRFGSSMTLVRRRTKIRSRRGMTLIVALALMAVAMTLSYAVLRTQGMAVQIQANSNLGERARQAAWSGFFAGVRNMHQTSWAGVNTVFNGSVNGYDSYSVAYATGDPSLTAASAQYS